ncbi:MAG: hypothetical protein ACK5IC_02925 [Moheibacter sp.]
MIQRFTYTSLLIVFLIPVFALAQKKSDSLVYDKCKERIKTVDTKLNYLKKKPYNYTDSYFFRAYNSKKDYIAFQLVKIKGKREIFLYVKSFTFNTCIRNGEVLEFMSETGISHSLDNEYQPNCSGVAIIKLSKKDLNFLINNPTISFMLFSFQKDYEFHLTEEVATRLREDLICLRDSKF